MVAFLAMLALSVTSVGAQTNDDSYVGGEVRSETVILPAAAAAPATAGVANSSLALTGGDAMTIGLIGVVAVMAGGALLVVRRRTASV